MSKSKHGNTVIVYENSCGSCKSGFDKENKTPVKFECQHVICKECWKPEKFCGFMCMLCPLCGQFAFQRKIDRTRFILPQQAITDLTENIKKSEETITSLREQVAEENRKNQELEEYKRKVECTTGTVNCSECGNTDNEMNIQVCNTCSLKGCDDLEECKNQMISSGVEVESIAICSTCAIRNHMKKGHTVNDIYPIMRYTQYTAHFEEVKPKRRKMEENKSELKSSVDKMWETIDDGDMELDKMTGMLKRSKTSDLQQKLVDRIDVEIIKHQEFIRKLNTFIEDMNGIMKKEVVDLMVKNDEEESTNCQEQIEH